MRPVIAIIGRPNVGKSSLFNRLLRHRQAIVSAISGTTRDRLYAPVAINGKTVDIVDTAGISGDLAEQDFGHEMLEQVQVAVQEADLLVFMLNAQDGLTAEDQQLAEIIRKSDTPTVVFINKVDSPDMDVDQRLLNLGLGETINGSLIHRRGHDELEDYLASFVSKLEYSDDAEAIDHSVPRVAIAGRPNVGKSTLFNALVGDDRVIVSDIAGTTRDTIDTKIELTDGSAFVVTDTAGLRRRGKIGRAEKLEQYSVIRTMRAIDQADIVLVVIDATEGLTRGDAHVADYALQQNKQIITVINKTDLVDDPQKVNFRRFPFLSRRPMIFISAKDQTFIEQLLELIQECSRNLDETQSQSSSPEIQ